MATRYWVGGAGNWSSTTKWSTTSGGTSGASVPISTDDVVFDANSGLVGAIATVDTAQTCNNLTITPGATVGFSTIAITVSLTVNGTFSMSGTAGNQRFLICGTTYGLATNFVVAAASSLSDLDFRDLIVTGTASPLSGTRIGNLRGVQGVTFPNPKTVYWNLSGAQNWSANGWAATSGGAPATSNFPLAQDTAVFNNTGSVTGAITMDSAIPYTGTVDMSARTSAMTLVVGTFTVYGDWKNGTGTSFSGLNGPTFSGRSTQTITCAGVSFAFTTSIDSYGGTVQLGDAFTSTSSVTVTNGTFSTANFSFSATSILSNNSNVRSINLGSSTVTLTGTIFFTPSTNLTFNAGTSTINIPGNNATLNGGSGLTFYNVNLTAPSSASNFTISGANTFNNLTLNPSTNTGSMNYVFSANQTVTGALTCAGASVIRRVFLRSSTIGTQYTITAGSLSANDCDFRDIAIAGGGSGTSPTRAGDCGHNSGVNFPAPKTVYWNLAGAQNWSATAWATSSGGTPALNNFPLPQDTAVFDNTGSVTGTITIEATWNIGTFDASARTSAMTLTFSLSPSIYGNWKFGTGVTTSLSLGGPLFSKQGTQTITNNGVTFNCPIYVDSGSGTVSLADALSVASNCSFNVNSGTFDAVTFNVSTGTFVGGAASGTTSTIKMGSGTWTIGAAGSCWTMNITVTLYKGTANILLSDTTTSARTFAGGGYAYNKLTIGGSTGSSTLTITGNNQFSELASTKTVAFTLALGTTTQIVGVWSATGTVGNVITLTGTATISVSGSRVTGVDYLALGTTVLSSTSPGEFYAGANSTGGTGFILTTAPVSTTRYWRGGTGTWDATTTTNWSASSGGAGGASVPTSADAVVFNSASNATAYTVTCSGTQLRCGSLTIAGPASGNITFTGSTPLAIHGNVSLPATGLTLSYTGSITLSSSSTGKTFTTNGVTLASDIIVDGIGCEWSLGSALVDGSFNYLYLNNGSFKTANYNLTTGNLSVANGFKSASTNLDLGSSSVTLGYFGIFVGVSGTANGFTLAAGTSSIYLNYSGAYIASNVLSLTFNNVYYSNTTGIQSPSCTVNGSHTFANLSIYGRTGTGVTTVSFNANQTITGTLTLSAGTNAGMRTVLAGNFSTIVPGTTVSLTCNAVSALTDIDFRDITIAGNAVSGGNLSGTRLGNCGGNTGITFSAPKTVYWVGGTGSYYSGSQWATSSGGAGSINNIPLAQDTAIFDNNSGGAGMTVTLTDSGTSHFGTIDSSARTTNTMTLATGTAQPRVYGNWTNSSKITISGNGYIYFSGRSTQNITTAGATFTQNIYIAGLSNTVNFLDAFTCSQALSVYSGTLSDNGFNVSLTNTASATVFSFSALTVSVPITLSISGTWTLASSGTTWSGSIVASTVTVNGTGTVSLTSASSKTFAGAGASYSTLTLNQGGAGALTITGNNTFKNITNTYSATGATSISFGATSTTVSSFTASGAASNVLTISGTSAASPAILIYTGVSRVSSDYLQINNVKSYSPSATWYAGTHSTNGGTLGWIFTAYVASNGKFFFMF